MPKPPEKLPDSVLRDLALVPHRHREDAEQEAWLAILEGRDPHNAIRVYKRREISNDYRRKVHERAAYADGDWPQCYPPNSYDYDV